MEINGVIICEDELDYYLKRHLYSGARAYIVRKTNCTEQEAKIALDKIIAQDQQSYSSRTVDLSERANTAPVKCPRCGSTQISTGQRGYKILTGFLGSSKTVNRCANCGYKWEPSYWTRNR